MCGNNMISHAQAHKHTSTHTQHTHTNNHTQIYTNKYVCQNLAFIFINLGKLWNK